LLALHDWHDLPMADRLLRWAPLVLVCGAFAWMVEIAAAPIHDPDAWWHLRLGNDLIDLRTLDAPPHWSSFATVPWVPTEPLPEIVSAYVERWLGLPGLAVLFGVSLLLVVLVVQVTNRREAALLPATIATLLAVPAATLSLTARPQVVSFMLLPIVLAAWLQTERDLKARWWLVPLMWFWSLCHGFWIIGVAVGCVFVVGIALSRRAEVRSLLRLAAVAAASLAVVALNPVGLGVLEAPLVVNGIAPYVSEWQRTDLLTAAPLVAAVMIVATAGIWAVTRQRVTWSRLLMLGVAVVMLWYAERLVVVAALVAAPLFAHALDGVVTSSRGGADDAGRPGRTEWRALVGAAALAAVALVLVAPQTSDRPARVPVGLDAALDRLPAGTPIFNAYELGGWLAWRHPDLERYIDGLATPYSEAHVQDYVRADAADPGWYRVVRRSDAPMALVASDSALAKGLAGKGWTIEGRSDGYVLLSRPG
jgi:hypothetical protein